MKIISFATFKGGAGKTTALMMATSGLIDYGKRVCLLEADENRPLSKWRENSISAGTWDENIEIFDADEIDTLTAAFGQAEEGAFDFMLIDTHGGGSELNDLILANSNFVILPSGLTHNDLDEVLKTYEYVVQLFVEEKVEIGTAILKSRFPTGKLRMAQKSVDEILETLPTFDTPIFERDAYASIKLRGLLHKTLEKYENDKKNRILKTAYEKARKEALDFAIGLDGIEV